MLSPKFKRIVLTMLSATFPLISSVSNADLNQPLLGRGYDSDKTNATTQNCVVGRLEEAGQSTSLLRFNLEMDKNRFYEKFRMKANGEFTFKFVKGDNTTEFLKEVTDKNLDLNFVYNLSYQAPSLVFIPEGLSETGRLLADNPVGWKTSCGTDYISEHTRGAELFVAFRFRFNDYLSKTKFEATTNISSISDFGKMSLEIEKLSEKYSSSAKIDVVAYQVGGDPTKLGTILGDSSGEMQILDCNFDNIQGCKSAVNNVLQYSSGDFATDANNVPSQVGYKTASYLINGKQYPTSPLTAASKSQLDARKKAVEKLNVLEADLVKADQIVRYWQPRLSSIEYSNIVSTQSTISYEIGLVRNAAFNCYDNPAICITEYNKTSGIPTYQQSLLQTPPPIIRSSEILSTINEGSTSFNIFDSCIIPGEGTLLTGIRIEQPKGESLRYGIKLYYRQLNSNGTMGSQGQVSCGSGESSGAAQIVAPYGRVIVGYGWRMQTLDYMSFRRTFITALHVKACTIDTLSGKFNLNDCTITRSGESGGLNGWYEPSQQGDVDAENSTINGIGIGTTNGYFKLLRTYTSYFGEPDISDIRVSLVPTGGQKGNSFIRDTAGKVSYRVVARNIGPADAQNISISSYIPSGVDYFRVSPQQSICVPIGSNLQCKLDSLGSNGEEWIDIELDASAVKKGGFVISSLAASQANFDPIDTNNIAKEPNAGHGGSFSGYALLMLGLISVCTRVLSIRDSKRL